MRVYKGAALGAADAQAVMPATKQKCFFLSANVESDYGSHPGGVEVVRISVAKAVRAVCHRRRQREPFFLQ